MKFTNNDLTVEERELQQLLNHCLHSYMFYRKGTLPVKITIPRISQIAFKPEMGKDEVIIPVEFLEMDKKEKADDTLTGHSRTARNRKATSPISSSFKNELEPDTKK